MEIRTNTDVVTQDKRRSAWKENAIGYAFLAPSLILFSVFLFYPLLQSLYLSFHLTDPRGRIAAFVGLDNFTRYLPQLLSGIVLA